MFHFIMFFVFQKKIIVVQNQNMCRRWLLWITECGVVRRLGMYAYYNIPLQQILFLYLVGGHQLLFSLGDPLHLS